MGFEERNLQEIQETLFTNVIESVPAEVENEEIGDEEGTIIDELTMPSKEPTAD